MDKKDLEIVEILRQNARISFTDIAKRMRTSEATIRKRVRNLEDKGVIKGYTIIVDPVKLGFNIVSIVGFDVEPSKFLEIAKRLTEFKEIRYVATSTGDHMIMTGIWTKNTADLAYFLQKIGKVEGMKKICPAIITEKLKEI
ncbi:MAG TPA: Lrp/AsnC family transcriptional regulator [Thermoplasmata archaeon]|nr:Lrp/AsnC family transcriptional regulator [Thermoplasmata archaeon]